MKKIFFSSLFLLVFLWATTNLYGMKQKPPKISKVRQRSQSFGDIVRLPDVFFAILLPEVLAEKYDNFDKLTKQDQNYFFEYIKRVYGIDIKIKENR